MEPEDSGNIILTQGINIKIWGCKWLIHFSKETYTEHVNLVISAQASIME